MKKSHVIAVVAMLTGVPVASAQQPPAKPIWLIVPFPPGGVGDLVGRSISHKLTEALGQTVLVNNRPGGDTIIGTEFVARAAPDGHTLLIASSALVINPSLHKRVSYDTLKDFAPITLVTQYPYLVVVHPSVPARSIKELIALAKANPGKLTYGTSGSAPQLAGGWLKYLTGINMTHVPYKGSGPALTDLIGGHISLTFTSPAAPLPFVRSGRLRVLAVTARTRADFLPNVPTVMEAGFPDYNVTGWLGLLAPGGTPRETVARLNAGMVRILRLPEIKEQFSREGMHPGGHSPEEFASFLKAETEIWSRAVQVTGLKAE